MSQAGLIIPKKEVTIIERENYPIQPKGVSRIFAPLLTTLHIFLYSSVMGLLVLIWTIQVSMQGLMFFWPMHAMFGWGFGCGLHLILFLSYHDKVGFLSRIRQRPYFGAIFITHAWFYLSISIYLIILNVLYSEFPWSVFAIMGWGIGFGYHVIIASLMPSKKEINLKKIRAEKIYFCYNCGTELEERDDYNYCAACGNKFEKVA